MFATPPRHQDHYDYQPSRQQQQQQNTDVNGQQQQQQQQDLLVSVKSNSDQQPEEVEAFVKNPTQPFKWHPARKQQQQQQKLEYPNIPQIRRQHNNNTVSVASEVAETYPQEVDAYINPTLLFKYINTSNIENAIQQAVISPKEAKIWISSRKCSSSTDDDDTSNDTNNKITKKIGNTTATSSSSSSSSSIRWKYLPLHLACLHPNPSAPLINALLEAYPKGARYRDFHGNFPLHYLISEGRCDDLEIFGSIVEYYPDGMGKADGAGRKMDQVIEESVCNRECKVWLKEWLQLYTATATATTTANATATATADTAKINELSYKEVRDEMIAQRQQQQQLNRQQKQQQQQQLKQQEQQQQQQQQQQRLKQQNNLTTEEREGPSPERERQTTSSTTSLDKDHNIIKQEFTSLRTRCDLKDSMIDSLSTQIKAVEADIKLKSTKITTLESKINEDSHTSVTKYDTLHAQCLSKDDAIEVLRVKMKSIEKNSVIQINAIKSQCEHKDGVIGILTDQIASLESKCKGDYHDAINKINTYQAQCDQKDETIAILNGKVEKLGIKIESENKTSADKIKNLKKQCKLRDEKIGNLTKIENEYHISIKTINTLQAQSKQKDEDLEIITAKAARIKKQLEDEYLSSVKKINTLTGNCKDKDETIDTLTAQVSTIEIPYKNEIQSKIDKIKSLQSQRKENDKTIDSLTIQLTDLKTKTTDSHQSDMHKFESLQSQYRLKTEAIATLTAELTTLKQTTATHNQTNVDTIANLQSQTTLKDETITTLTTQITTLTKQFAENRLEGDAKDSTIAASHTRIALLENRLDRGDKSNAALNAQMAQDAGIVSSQHDRITYLERTLGQVREDMEEKDVDIEGWKVRCQELERGVKSGEEAVVHMRQVVDIIQDELNSKEKENVKVRVQLEESQTRNLETVFNTVSSDQGGDTEGRNDDIDDAVVRANAMYIRSKLNNLTAKFDSVQVSSLKDTNQRSVPVVAATAQNRSGRKKPNSPVHRWNDQYNNGDDGHKNTAASTTIRSDYQSPEKKRSTHDKPKQRTSININTTNNTSTTDAISDCTIFTTTPPYGRQTTTSSTLSPSKQKPATKIRTTNNITILERQTALQKELGDIYSEIQAALIPNLSTPATSPIRGRKVAVASELKSIIDFAATDGEGKQRDEQTRMMQMNSSDLLSGMNRICNN